MIRKRGSQWIFQYFFYFYICIVCFAICSTCCKCSQKIAKLCNHSHDEAPSGQNTNVGLDTRNNDNNNTKNIIYYNNGIDNHDTKQHLFEKDEANVNFYENPIYTAYPCKNQSTNIYLAGYDDEILKLKNDIEKHGVGNEVLVYFFLYKDRKYYCLGNIYTNLKVLEDNVSKYTHYYCLDRGSLEKALCSHKAGLLQKHLKHKNDDIPNIEQEVNNYDKKPIFSYDIVFPNEKNLTIKDILVNMYKFKERKANQSTEAMSNEQNTTNKSNYFDEGNASLEIHQEHNHGNNNQSSYYLGRFINSGKNDSLNNEQYYLHKEQSIDFQDKPKIRYWPPDIMIKETNSSDTPGVHSCYVLNKTSPAHTPDTKEMNFEYNKSNDRLQNFNEYHQLFELKNEQTQNISVMKPCYLTDNENDKNTYLFNESKSNEPDQKNQNVSNTIERLKDEYYKKHYHNEVSIDTENDGLLSINPKIQILSNANNTAIGTPELTSKTITKQNLFTINNNINLKVINETGSIDENKGNISYCLTDLDIDSKTNCDSKNLQNALTGTHKKQQSICHTDNETTDTKDVKEKNTSFPTAYALDSKQINGSSINSDERKYDKQELQITEQQPVIISYIEPDILTDHVNIKDDLKLNYEETVNNNQPLQYDVTLSEQILTPITLNSNADYTISNTLTQKPVNPCIFKKGISRPDVEYETLSQNVTKYFSNFTSNCYNNYPSISYLDTSYMNQNGIFDPTIIQPPNIYSYDSNVCSPYTQTLEPISYPITWSEPYLNYYDNIATSKSKTPEGTYFSQNIAPGNKPVNLKLPAAVPNEILYQSYPSYVSIPSYRVSQNARCRYMSMEHAKPTSSDTVRMSIERPNDSYFDWKLLSVDSNLKGPLPQLHYFHPFSSNVDNIKNVRKEDMIKNQSISNYTDMSNDSDVISPEPNILTSETCDYGKVTPNLNQHIKLNSKDKNDDPFQTKYKPRCVEKELRPIQEPDKSQNLYQLDSYFTTNTLPTSKVDFSMHLQPNKFPNSDKLNILNTCEHIKPLLYEDLSQKPVTHAHIRKVPSSFETYQSMNTKNEKMYDSNIINIIPCKKHNFKLDNNLRNCNPVRKEYSPVLPTYSLKKVKSMLINKTNIPISREINEFYKGDLHTNNNVIPTTDKNIQLDLAFAENDKPVETVHQPCHLLETYKLMPELSRGMLNNLESLYTRPYSYNTDFPTSTKLSIPVFDNKQNNLLSIQYPNKLSPDIIPAFYDKKRPLSNLVTSSLTPPIRAHLDNYQQYTPTSLTPRIELKDPIKTPISFKNDNKSANFTHSNPITLLSFPAMSISTPTSSNVPLEDLQSPILSQKKYSLTSPLSSNSASLAPITSYSMLSPYASSSFITTNPISIKNNSPIENVYKPLYSRNIYVNPDQSSFSSFEISNMLKDHGESHDISSSASGPKVNDQQNKYYNISNGVGKPNEASSFQKDLTLNTRVSLNNVLSVPATLDFSLSPVVSPIVGSQSSVLQKSYQENGPLKELTASSNMPITEAYLKDAQNFPTASIILDTPKHNGITYKSMENIISEITPTIDKNSELSKQSPCNTYPSSTVKSFPQFSPIQVKPTKQANDKSQPKYENVEPPKLKESTIDKTRSDTPKYDLPHQLLESIPNTQFTYYRTNPPTDSASSQSLKWLQTIKSPQSKQSPNLIAWNYPSITKSATSNIQAPTNQVPIIQVPSPSKNSSFYKPILINDDSKPSMEKYYFKPTLFYQSPLRNIIQYVMEPQLLSPSVLSLISKRYPQSNVFDPKIQPPCIRFSNYQTYSPENPELMSSPAMVQPKPELAPSIKWTSDLSKNKQPVPNRYDTFIHPKTLNRMSSISPKGTSQSPATKSPVKPCLNEKNSYSYLQPPLSKVYLGAYPVKEIYPSQIPFSSYNIKTSFVPQSADIIQNIQLSSLSQNADIHKKGDTNSFPLQPRFMTMPLRTSKPISSSVAFNPLMREVSKDNIIEQRPSSNTVKSNKWYLPYAMPKIELVESGPSNPNFQRNIPWSQAHKKLKPQVATSCQSYQPSLKFYDWTTFDKNSIVTKPVTPMKNSVSYLSPMGSMISQSALRPYASSSFIYPLIDQALKMPIGIKTMVLRNNKLPSQIWPPIIFKPNRSNILSPTKSQLSNQTSTVAPWSFPTTPLLILDRSISKKAASPLQVYSKAPSDQVLEIPTETKFPYLYLTYSSPTNAQSSKKPCSTSYIYTNPHRAQTIQTQNEILISDKEIKDETPYIFSDSKPNKACQVPCRLPMSNEIANNNGIGNYDKFVNYLKNKQNCKDAPGIKTQKNQSCEQKQTPSDQFILDKSKNNYNASTTEVPYNTYTLPKLGKSNEKYNYYNTANYLPNEQNIQHETPNYKLLYPKLNETAYAMNDNYANINPSISTMPYFKYTHPNTCHRSTTDKTHQTDRFIMENDEHLETADAKIVGKPEVIGPVKQITSALQNIGVIKYEPCKMSNELKIPTDNPDIAIRAWKSKYKIVKFRIVADVYEREAYNFEPIIDRKYLKKYDLQAVEDTVKSYVQKYYGEPIVFKGGYSFYRPYAIYDINEKNMKNGIYFIWPILCHCGCNKFVCQCQA